MSATITPTPAAITPAAIAARGTLTLTPGGPALPMPTLAECMASFDDAAKLTGVSSKFLEGLALAAFREAAESLASSLDGRPVLPRNLKAAAQAIVWRAATGSPVPVPAAIRTPAERALGDYLSRFATVATNAAHGIAKLTTPAAVRVTAKAISAGVKASKDGETTRARNALAARYSKARETMTKAQRDAHVIVSNYYAHGGGNAEFAPLYAAGIVAAAESAPIQHGPHA